MHSHPQAGELLLALEAWLHARPGGRSVDVTVLLSPYRGAGEQAAHAHAGRRMIPTSLRIPCGCSA